MNVCLKIVTVVSSLLCEIKGYDGRSMIRPEASLQEIPPSSVLPQTRKS